MAGVSVRSLDQPDDVIDYGPQGQSQGVAVEHSVVWRSTLLPGWSWENNARPQGASEWCPLSHREYVVSGRIRYRMKDGTVAEAGPGDHIVVGPGHAAEVVGDEACVLIDW